MYKSDFIELTLSSGMSIHICKRKIQSFYLDTDDIRYASIMIDGNLVYTVKESVPDIINLLG